MTIKDHMVEGVETAGPDATVEALAMRLEQASIGSVVIEKEMEPVGIVTDRDLALRVDARGRSPSALTAADVMTEDPVTVREDAPLLDVTRTMREHSVRRLPVVSSDGTLVGIVTFDDLMQLFVTEMANLSSVIGGESPFY